MPGTGRGRCSTATASSARQISRQRLERSRARPVGLAQGTYVAAVRLTYPDRAGTGVATSSAAPQFTVSKLSHGFRPHPPTTAAAPSAPTHGGSWWPWLAAGGGALVAVTGVVALRRRRPVTVTVRPVRPVSAEAARCAGFHYWEVDWDHAVPARTSTVRGWESLPVFTSS